MLLWLCSGFLPRVQQRGREMRCSTWGREHRQSIRGSLGGGGEMWWQLPCQLISSTGLPSEKVTFQSLCPVEEIHNHFQQRKEGGRKGVSFSHGAPQDTVQISWIPLSDRQGLVSPMEKNALFVWGWLGCIGMVPGFDIFLYVSEHKQIPSLIFLFSSVILYMQFHAFFHRCQS